MITKTPKEIADRLQKQYIVTVEAYQLALQRADLQPNEPKAVSLYEHYSIASKEDKYKRAMYDVIIEHSNIALLYSAKTSEKYALWRVVIDNMWFMASHGQQLAEMEHVYTVLVKSPLYSKLMREPKVREYRQRLYKRANI